RPDRRSEACSSPIRTRTNIICTSPPRPGARPRKSRRLLQPRRRQVVVVLVLVLLLQRPPRPKAISAGDRSAMPAAAGPPHPVRSAGAAGVLLLHPARKGAVRTVVPPVIVAVGLERAVVVERPFAVGVSEAVDERTAEAAVAPDVAAIADRASVKVVRRRPDSAKPVRAGGWNPHAADELRRGRGGGERKCGAEQRSREQLRIHVAAPWNSDAVETPERAKGRTSAPPARGTARGRSIHRIFSRRNPLVRVS